MADIVETKFRIGCILITLQCCNQPFIPRSWVSVDCHSRQSEWYVLTLALPNASPLLSSTNRQTNMEMYNIEEKAYHGTPSNSPATKNEFLLNQEFPWIVCVSAKEQHNLSFLSHNLPYHIANTIPSSAQPSCLVTQDTATTKHQTLYQPEDAVLKT